MTGKSSTYRILPFSLSLLPPFPINNGPNNNNKPKWIIHSEIKLHFKELKPTITDQYKASDTPTPTIK
jgi:hypothetical protein